MTTVKRATVGLDKDDVADIEKIKEPGSLHNIAITSLTGATVGPPSSQSQLVHALVQAGRRAVEQQAEEIGYRRLAEFKKNDPESQAWRASRRARFARRHNGEQNTA